MWLYFNRNGQLIETLVHGNRARSGTTDFKIFAYFEGINLSSFTEASLKLRKPDLQETEYPSLLMTRTTGNGEQFILGSGESSHHFVNGQYYQGFYFDFADFNEDEDVAVLLDTPGLWKAVITLIGGTGVLNVQGIASFLVENGNFTPDGTDVSIETVLNQIYIELSTLLPKTQGIISVTSAPTDLSGVAVNQMYYILNADKTVNVLKRIKEEDNVKSLEEIFDFNNALQKQTGIHLVYTNNGLGVPSNLTYTQNATPSTIASRDDNGKMQVVTPVSTDAGTTVANKEYTDTKVAKVTGSYRIYGTHADGVQTSFPYAQNPAQANTIVMRTNTGTIKTAAPTENDDATTKSYVDDKFVQKSETTTGYEAYGRKAGAEHVWAVDDSFSANSIALRDTYGRLQVGSPNDNTDATTKQYVDTTENVLHPSDVKNDLTSTDTNKPLSANQGKVLSDKIANLEGRGRFLSIWNASSGQPADLPSDIATNTYTYRNGDYFIVGTVGAKYPTGTNVPAGTTLPTFPSETRQTSAFVNDTIVYNGSTHTWTLVSGFVTATFSSITGQPYDNANLTTALNAKQNQVIHQEEEPQNVSVGDIWVKEATNNTVTYIAGVGINIANNTISADTTVLATKTDLNSYETSSHASSTYQTKINSSNKLSSDLVNDADSTNKFVTSADKTTWNNKQNALSQNQLVATNSGITSEKVSTYDGYATSKQNTIDSSNKLSSNLVNDADSTNKFVTSAEKSIWNGKQDVLGFTPENVANKVTSLTAQSTNTQYPSAKCVYDINNNLQEQINNLKLRGRFLSTWDGSNGKPSDLPSTIATESYVYKTGDYFIVKTAGNKNPTVPENNTIPAGTTLDTWNYFTTGTQVEINDTIYFTGSAWEILHTPVVQTVWGGIGGTLSDQADLQNALEDKITKVTNGNRIYGTDSSGNQTTYSNNDFGKIDDVKVNGTTVVTNKIANIDISGKVDKITGSSLVPDTKISSYEAHLNNTSNPHNVTKSQVGLSNVVNASLDNSPTSGSNNYVKSGGVYSSLSAKQNNLTAGIGINISSDTIKAIGVEYKNNDTAQANALKFVRLTQTQYDAIETKDADTFYMIIG